MSARVLAIVQARLGSSRLPGKALRNIAGRPMLWHVLRRAQAIRGVHQVMLATTDTAQDEVLVDLARSEDVACFRGSVQDVLDRFRSAALACPADVIVRVTGDCPLLDPNIHQRVLEKFLSHAGTVDYVSNIEPPTFPDGLDAEVFSSAALERTWQEAQLPSEREHVTLYMREPGRGFKRLNEPCSEDLSAHRWTVDREPDLAFVRSVYGALAPEGERIFCMDEVLSLLRAHPELVTRNAGIKRNEALELSRARDPQHG